MLTAGPFELLSLLSVKSQLLREDVDTAGVEESEEVLHLHLMTGDETAEVLELIRPAHFKNA